MSNLVPYSNDQLELIKSTIAKGATDDELKLFLYRAQSMGLDPLKPGQIHFVKYGNSAGTIIVGIDGFRAKAHASGKFAGIKRGILRNDTGQCIGGWCEVYRSDWKEAAREEVALHEYDTGKGPWSKMKETMIKKVAEAAALRMAFPDELGGVYTQEEMHQAEIDVTKPKTLLEAVTQRPVIPPKQTNIQDPGDYICRIGKKYVGMALKDIMTDELISFVKWIETESADGFRNKPDAQEFIFYAKQYIQSESTALFDESPPEEFV